MLRVMLESSEHSDEPTEACMAAKRQEFGAAAFSTTGRGITMRAVGWLFCPGLVTAVVVLVVVEVVTSVG